MEEGTQLAQPGTGQDMSWGGQSWKRGYTFSGLAGPCYTSHGRGGIGSSGFQAPGNSVMEEGSV